MKQNIRILIVEDEKDINDILKDNLENSGYKTDQCFSAEEAVKKDLSVYDLFIFDIMLEKMTGKELAQKTVSDEKTKDIPVIFLTAKDTEGDKLEGFDLGADDYITKPFSIKEVIARVKVVLKRVNGDFYPAGKGIELDDMRKSILVDGKEILLTKKEYLLLDLFMSNRRILFARQQLLDTVWEDEGMVTDRAVDVMVRRLRKKLGSDGNKIKTRTGLGYIYDP